VLPSKTRWQSTVVRDGHAVRANPSDQHIPLTDELAGVFARMSGLLLTEETVQTAVGVLSSLAQETVPGSSGAGISLVDGRRRVSWGATDARVGEADSLQYQLDEGPCLTAAISRELIRIDDLSTEPRWPRWAAATLPLGMRAAMSAPLVAGDVSLGAIKVYADDPGTFDARGEQLLSLFAAQAAFLVANVQSAERARRLSDGMREAIRSRDAVNVAKGILMARSNLDEETALALLLRRAAQDGTDVAGAARALVDATVRRRR
jgi:GAF domain-containing protein